MDRSRVVLVLVCACGPAVEVTAGGTDGSTSTVDSGDEVGTVAPTGDPTSASATTMGSASSPSSTTTTASTTDDPAPDTGEFGCPYAPCDVSTYCDLDTGECLPKPETPPTCAPERVALVPERVVDASPGALALGLANTDGVGARELVVVTVDGVVEIWTADLDAISTAALGFAVSNALVAGRAADGFGRIWARRADDGQMFAFDADGAGGLVSTPLEFVGGAMAAADIDGDSDTDLAVAVDNALQIVVASETVELGLSIDLGAAARSVGSTRGEDGVDLIVGTDTALLRLRGDGAGGFGAPESTALLHAADVVGGFGGEFVAGAFALDFDASSSLSLANDQQQAWRWLLPDVGVSAAPAVATYGDPGSTQEVLLLGGADRVTIIVDPQYDQPCLARFDSAPVRAILPDGSVPVIATDGVLTRMALQ